MFFSSVAASLYLKPPGPAAKTAVCLAAAAAAGLSSGPERCFSAEEVVEDVKGVGVVVAVIAGLTVIAVLAGLGLLLVLLVGGDGVPGQLHSDGLTGTVNRQR